MKTINLQNTAELKGVTSKAVTKAPLEKLWLGEEVTQFDFYDRADFVAASADAAADFIKA